MGTAAKPLTLLAGRPLIAHVLARLRPQCSALAVVMRRRESWAADLEAEVLTDPVEAGPLGGVAAALSWAQADGAVLTCAADEPFIPVDLVERLSQALCADTDVAVAASDGRRHRLTALWRTGLCDRLMGALRQDGAVAVHAFQARLRVADVVWPLTPVDPFFNINTPEDLADAERMWSAAAGREDISP